MVKDITDTSRTSRLKIPSSLHWSELTFNKHRKGLSPAMLSKKGHVEVGFRRLNAHGDKHYLAIIYDHHYVYSVIDVMILKPLGIKSRKTARAFFMKAIDSIFAMKEDY